MSTLVKEILELKNEIIESNNVLTSFEAMQIAVRIQHNRILSDAFLLGLKSPSALEAIAIQLGAGSDTETLKSALYAVANAIQERN